MKTLMFFRNDDVRDTLDRTLLEITDLFIDYKIPITHAVEPANVSGEVIKWLIRMKEFYPDLIEIMQHGYDHTIKNKKQKGEFGGQRTYDEQFSDIYKGKELMNEYFGDLWFEAFNFPYAPYNDAAIKALNDCDFKVMNSHFNSDISRRIFYSFGHLLNRGRLFDKHVSWNLNYYPNTKLFEIDVNTGFIRKYIDEIDQCEFLSLEELKEDTSRYFKQKTVGVLLHHRYHNSKSKLELVDKYLKWCSTLPNVEFSTIEGIYKRLNSNTL